MKLMNTTGHIAAGLIAIACTAAQAAPQVTYRTATNIAEAVAAPMVRAAATASTNYTDAAIAAIPSLTETDPTVPAWAKQPNPPEGLATNSLVWTGGAVQTKDGTVTVGAESVGAYTTSQTDERLDGRRSNIEMSVFGSGLKRGIEKWVDQGFGSTQLLWSDANLRWEGTESTTGDTCAIQPEIIAGSNDITFSYFRNGSRVGRYSNCFTIDNYHAITTDKIAKVSDLPSDYDEVKAKALNSAQYYEYGWPFLGRKDLMVKDAMVVGTTNYTQRANHTEYCDGTIQNEALSCYLYLPYGKSGNIAVEDPFEVSRLMAIASTNDAAKAATCSAICTATADKPHFEVIDGEIHIITITERSSNDE